MRPSLRNRCVVAASEGLLFLTLALLSTAPLAARFTTHLPTGSERSATVALLNLWTIGWNVDRLGHGYRGYWDAPIYFPTRHVLALSEPQPVAGWLAWPLWRQVPTPVAVYNTLVLLFLTANGWAACALLQRLGVNWPAAVLGGALMTLLPLVHWQLGVLQLVSLWGICWTLSAVHAAIRRGRIRDGVHAGVAFSCTYLLGCYFGLMLSILLLLCVPWWCGRRMLALRFWRAGGAALLTAALLLAPVVVPQVVVSRTHPALIPRETIRRLSARPVDYLAAPAGQWLPPTERPRGVGLALSPGTGKYLVAVIGAAWGWRRRRYRRLVQFLLAMTAVAMILSMGPRLSWGNWAPFDLLAEYYPGFRQARNVFRFAFFVQVSVVFLAALGCEAAYRRISRTASRSRSRRVAPALCVALLAVLLAGEAWPPPPRLFAMPPHEPRAPWVEWLSQPQQADVRLVCLPLAHEGSAAAHQQTTIWMYQQMSHGRPLANGYSAVVPDDYARLEEALSGFPSATGIAALHTAGVTHCLFDAAAGAVVVPTALRALGCDLALDDRRAQVQIWRLPSR